jgi:hypothetical protein
MLAVGNFAGFEFINKIYKRKKERRKEKWLKKT